MRSFVAVLLLPALAHGASCPRFEKGKPEGVVVGIYVNQIAAIDVKNNTFLADFYMWFRWSGERDPNESMELVNAVEPWSFYKEAVYKDEKGQLKADVLPDGCKFQQYHVQGRFAHAFDLSAYPLDHQEVTIRLEDSKYTSDELYYVADTTDARVDPAIQIPAGRSARRAARSGSTTTPRRWAIRASRDCPARSIATR